MNLRTMLVFTLILITPCLSHAGWFSSNKSLIEGDWYRGTDNQPAKPFLHFEKGIITRWANGQVFGTYEFVDRDRLRFKQTIEDTETVSITDYDGHDKEFEMPTVRHVDQIILIEFPSDDQMQLYRIRGNERFKWWTFTRFKK